MTLLDLIDDVLGDLSDLRSIVLANGTAHTEIPAPEMERPRLRLASRDGETIPTSPGGFDAE